MPTGYLQIAKRLQAIAQAGLTYCDNKYDIERYEELRDIAVDMASQAAGFDPGFVRKVFTSEEGYPTPKVDVRSVVFREGRILMVKETIDGLWSLPGGWADVGYSPFEVAAKETWEESGFRVEPVRLLAVHDKDKHDHPADIYAVYKMFILCRIVGGEGNTGIETSEIGFFDRDHLPVLSTPRVTEPQIRMLFDFYDHPDKPALCD